MEISIEESGDKGFAIAKKEGKKVGLMTFTAPAEDHIIIDHTEVEPEYEGEGIGMELLNKVVAMAREKNIKIVPECSYAAAMFQKTQSIQDVLKK